MDKNLVEGLNSLKENMNNNEGELIEADKDYIVNKVDQMESQIDAALSDSDLTIKKAEDITVEIRNTISNPRS